MGICNSPLPGEKALVYCISVKLRFVEPMQGKASIVENQKKCGKLFSNARKKRTKIP